MPAAESGGSSQEKHVKVLKKALNKSGRTANQAARVRQAVSSIPPGTGHNADIVNDGTQKTIPDAFVDTVPDTVVDTVPDTVAASMSGVEFSPTNVNSAADRNLPSSRS